MLFKNGTYKHKNGGIIYIKDGIPFLSSDWPMAMRTAEIFNTNNWEVLTDGSENKG